MAGEKSDDFSAKRIAADCARPSDTLAAEKNFSDAHVVRKMISLFRTCGRELCEAFFVGDGESRPLCFAAAHQMQREPLSVYLSGRRGRRPLQPPAGRTFVGGGVPDAPHGERKELRAAACTPPRNDPFVARPSPTKFFCNNFPPFRVFTMKGGGHHGSFAAYGQRP